MHSEYIYTLQPCRQTTKSILDDTAKPLDYVQCHVFFVVVFLHPVPAFLKFLLSTISAHGNYGTVKVRRKKIVVAVNEKTDTTAKVI